MRILVTGATGYVGSAVSAALTREGHHVAGLSRSAASRAALAKAGQEAVPGDLTDLESLRRAAQGADGVIHAACAALGPAGGAIDRAAVESMLEALAGTQKPFVYTSGVWVYGDTQGRVMGEVAMLHPPPLVAWRPAVEEIVLSTKTRLVRPVVLRPGIVIGRNGGLLAGMFAQARAEGKVTVPGDGEHCWSTVHVDDLAELYVHAVTNPAPGELFAACGGTPQPAAKIARAVAKACGIEGRVELATAEEARARFGELAECLAMDQRVASTKAARLFGWTVRKPSIYEEIFSGSYVAA